MMNDLNIPFFRKTMFAGMATLFLSTGVTQANPVSAGEEVTEKHAAALPLQKKVTITGVVKDALGPVVGANVVEKGTTNGTVTDMEGRFSLQVSSNAVLIISYIGYIDQAIPVNGKSSFTVLLKEDSQALDEVVVVGYGTQKKVNLSGAVDAISSEALEDRPIINAGQGLQGVIPNLNITISNGAANSTPSFNIRGETSLNGGDPLILVDNIPTTSGELSRLNTNDIESVSVLKDAASAAIYGARAAFGVILVTTKRAKSEKIAINVNAFYSTRKVTRVPEHVTDPYTVMKIKHDAATPLYNLYPEKQLEIGKYFSEHPNDTANLDRSSVSSRHTGALSNRQTCDTSLQRLRNRSDRLGIQIFCNI